MLADLALVDMVIVGLFYFAFPIGILVIGVVEFFFRKVKRMLVGGLLLFAGGLEAFYSISVLLASYDLSHVFPIGLAVPITITALTLILGAISLLKGEGLRRRE